MNEDSRKELGGVVFRNGGKVSDKHPDWVGRCTIKGQAYSVALWEKESQRTGVPFMSLSFRTDWGDDDIDPGLREFYRLGEELFRLGCWMHKAHSERDPERKLKKVLSLLNQAHKELSAIAPPLNTLTLPPTL